MTAPRALARAPELRLPTGTVLFRQGDPGEEMFVIARGRVRLTLRQDDHEQEVDLLGPGDFFGELSLLSGAPRTASAQVIEEATLLSIRRDVFGMMMQDDLDVVFRMMNVIGQRLSHANQQVRDHMQRLARVRVFAHCLRQHLATPETAISLEVDATARELDMSHAEVRTAVEQAVLRGAGMLREGRWVVDAEQARTLLGEVCRVAAGGT
jgi:CRP-like cAMP-binding protein